jgi:hypothetical protein
VIEIIIRTFSGRTYLLEGVPGLANVDGEIHFGSDGLEFQANSIYPDLMPGDIWGRRFWKRIMKLEKKVLIQPWTDLLIWFWR